jgi:hypothetical protein
MLLVEKAKVVFLKCPDCISQFKNLLIEEVQSLLRCGRAMEVSDGILDQVIIWESFFNDGGSNTSRRGNLIVLEIKIYKDGPPTKLKRVVNEDPTQGALPGVMDTCNQN